PRARPQGAGLRPRHPARHRPVARRRLRRFGVVGARLAREYGRAGVSAGGHRAACCDRRVSRRMEGGQTLPFRKYADAEPGPRSRTAGDHRMTANEPVVAPPATAASADLPLAPPEPVAAVAPEKAG